MFNPGETVAHKFIIPFDSSVLSKVIVTYKQCDNVFLSKTITSGFESYDDTPEYSELTFPVSKGTLCTYNDDGYKAKQNIEVQEAWNSEHWDATEIPPKTKILYALTQDESLLFKDNANFMIQINVLTLDGSRYASKEIKDSTGAQHYKEVMQDES